jgi:hypothetical protein
MKIQQKTKKILKNKNHVRKKTKKMWPKRLTSSIFFLIFAQNIDDMLSAIFFKKNKIDLPFFACFDFDH